MVQALSRNLRILKIIIKSNYLLLHRLKLCGNEKSISGVTAVSHPFFFTFMVGYVMIPLVLEYKNR